MASPVRNFFSMASLPAHFLRLVCVLAALIIINKTLDTVAEFNEAERVLSLIQGDSELMGAEDGGAIETVNFTPRWLMQAHVAAAILAGLGAVIGVFLAGTKWGQVLSVSLVCLAMAAMWVPNSLVENLPNLGVSKVGENPSSAAYYMELGLVVFLILSPPMLIWAFHAAPILDRYVLGAVIMPFTMCFVGIISIWVIMDLTDNGKAFISSGAGLGMLGYYYLVQLPQIILMVLPITLLLSLLYGLSKMSRSNEIISMLGSGLSLGRVLQPLLLIGLYFSVVCVVLKYEWAPNSEARKEGILNKLEDIAKEDDDDDDKEEYAASAWMYRNGMAHRTWLVGRVPVNLASAPMRYVAIWEQGRDGRVNQAYRAEAVTWDYRTKSWTLSKCTTFDYNEYGFATIKEHPILTISEWKETPWHVVSSSYKAEYLGVPGLTNYLRSNQAIGDKKLSPYRTHWHYSWAEPLRCILLVLMAAPLGIVHGRRGVLGGVAACMGIFFGLIFFDSFFLSMGKTARIPAWLGAWGPNILLLIVGCYLFYIRSAGKEVPKLKSLFSRRKATA